MFVLRTSQWGRRREPAGRALRAVGRLLGRAALIVAMLMLATFVTVEISEACPGSNNPTALNTPTATQVIANQQVIAN